MLQPSSPFFFFETVEYLAEQGKHVNQNMRERNPRRNLTASDWNVLLCCVFCWYIRNPECCIAPPKYVLSRTFIAKFRTTVAIGGVFYDPLQIQQLTRVRPNLFSLSVDGGHQSKKHASSLRNGRRRATGRPPLILQPLSLPAVRLYHGSLKNDARIDTDPNVPQRVIVTLLQNRFFVLASLKMCPLKKLGASDPCPIRIISLEIHGSTKAGQEVFRTIIFSSSSFSLPLPLPYYLFQFLASRALGSY